MWNLASSSKRCSERNLHRDHLIHSLKLSNAKSEIDNKEPKTIPQERFRARKERIHKDLQMNIQQDNRILLQKMLRIDTKLSELNPVYFQLSRPPSVSSLNIAVRKKQLNNITDENRRILTRLQNTRSNYSIKKWRNQFIHSQYLSQKLSENSGRVPKSTTYSPVGYEGFTLSTPKNRLSRPISADEFRRLDSRSGRPKTANFGVRNHSKVL